MPVASPDNFTDVSADAPCARAVEWALEKDLTAGTNPEGTIFSPDKIYNRREIAAFLRRNLAQQKFSTASFLLLNRPNARCPRNTLPCSQYLPMLHSST